MSASGGFLSRWSRRKQDAQKAPVESIDAGPEAVPPGDPPGRTEGLDAPTQPPLVPAQATAGGTGESSAEGLTPEEIAELPAIDEITVETDLKLFLRAGVPKALRNAALRRMWVIDPAVRDFVNDAREYAYDWNTPGGVPGFGPMRPTDDVQAMVSQVFGDGLPAEPQPSPGEPPPALHRIASPVSSDEMAARDGPTGESSVPQQTFRTAEKQEFDHPDILSQSDGVSSADGPMPSRSPGESCGGSSEARDGPASVAPRPRRHGGAMPV